MNCATYESFYERRAEYDDEVDVRDALICFHLALDTIARVISRWLCSARSQGIGRAPRDEKRAQLGGACRTLAQDVVCEVGIDEADRVELLEGREGAECVYGYFMDDVLVGVCGVGMRSSVMAYRTKVGREVCSPRDSQNG